MGILKRREENGEAAERWQIGSLFFYVKKESRCKSKNRAESLENTGVAEMVSSQKNAKLGDMNPTSAQYKSTQEGACIDFIYNGFCSSVSMHGGFFLEYHFRLYEYGAVEYYIFPK